MAVLEDIVLPVLTLQNAPADFAMTRNIQDAAEACANPAYSHVFLLHTPTAEERQYVQQLKDSTYSPERAERLRNGKDAGVFGQYYGNSFADRIRADNGQVMMNNTREALPEGPGREAFLARQNEASLNFHQAGRRMNRDWSPSNYQFGVLAASTNTKDVHQDTNPTGVMTLFGVGTPVASVTLAQQAADEGMQSVREALLSGAMQQTKYGIEFHPNAPLTKVAAFMFEAGPDMQVFIKPKPQGTSPANYKPSTHAFAWRNNKMTPQNDLRGRVLFS